MGLPIGILHQCIIHYFPVERMSPDDNQYEMTDKWKGVASNSNKGCLLQVVSDVSPPRNGR